MVNYLLAKPMQNMLLQLFFTLKLDSSRVYESAGLRLQLSLRNYVEVCLTVVYVIKLFWRKSVTSRIPLEPKQQQYAILK